MGNLRKSPKKKQHSLQRFTRKKGCRKRRKVNFKLSFRRSKVNAKVIATKDIHIHTFEKGKNSFFLHEKRQKNQEMEEKRFLEMLANGNNLSEDLFLT